MLRFAYVVLLGSFVACSWFACGEKLNPKGNEPTAVGGAGGSTDIGGIDAGESEAGACGAPAVDAGVSAPVTYAKTIAPMVAASCAISGCHSGSSPALNIGLDTYAGLKSFADLCNSAIQNGTMPIGDGKALTDADKKNFQAWVNAGAPNN
jgi:uncharacterized membrane protein